MVDKAGFQNDFKKWLNLDEWSHCPFMRNQHQWLEAHKMQKLNAVKIHGNNFII